MKKRNRKEIRRLRDCSVARLMELLREIRTYGKHAFRKEPKLHKAFQTGYMRKNRNQQKKK